jgi:hypothetical protein
MSLTKSDTKLGNYAETGTPKPHKSSVKHYELDRTSTMYLLWYLVKRHRMALLVTGNIILVLNWAIPAWPEMVKLLLQTIVQ